MKPDSFTRFIPDGFDLDPAAVKADGFAARPFPDYGNLDVAAVGRLAGAEQAELWCCEYRQEPHHLAGLSLDEANRQAFKLGYSNVLVALEAAQTHIWLPLEHEFFVIFAPLAALEKIRSAGIFTYDHDEYAHEPYFAGKMSELVIGAGRPYTIHPFWDNPDVSFVGTWTMLADFSVSIDYTQILVYTKSRAAPGLLWTDDHVAQGFAWSQGQVSFGVPDHDGECRIEVDLAQGEVLDPLALWAVQVPFSVTGPVEIGALFDMRSVAVSNGSYNLIYQALPGTDDYAYVLRLTFSQSDMPEFRILRKGGDITADAVLCRDAKLAQ